MQCGVREIPKGGSSISQRVRYLVFHRLMPSVGACSFQEKWLLKNCGDDPAQGSLQLLPYISHKCLPLQTLDCSPHHPTFFRAQGEWLQMKISCFGSIFFPVDRNPAAFHLWMLHEWLISALTLSLGSPV